MVNWIKMGGQERPVAFGYAVAYAYETQTGGNYNELIYRVAGEMEQAGRAINNNDLNAAATAVHVKPLTDLVFFGLKYAHRKEGVEIDFEPEDVAEWLFSDQNAITACITALFESLPQPKSEDAAQPSAAKKKTVARPGSTGKALSKQRRR